jgi:hypothetical protein
VSFKVHRYTGICILGIALVHAFFGIGFTFGLLRTF